jgi:hypothetical protein
VIEQFPVLDHLLVLNRTEGLVFSSHVTGGFYYAGIIQRQILKPKGERV